MNIEPDPTRYFKIPVLRIDADEIVWFRTDLDTQIDTKQTRRTYFLHIRLDGAWTDEKEKSLQKQLWTWMERKMEGVPTETITSIILESFAIAERFDEMTHETNCYLSIRWLARSDTEIYGGEEEDPVVAGIRDHINAIADQYEGKPCPECGSMDFEHTKDNGETDSKCLKCGWST